MNVENGVVLWTLLNLGKTTTTLLPEEGTLIQLETPVFLHLIDTHVIQVKDTSQSPTMALSAEVHRLLIEAGDEALEVANQRYLLVEAYQNKQQEIYAGTPTRTIRDWLTNFRDAEAAYGYGYGYVGLLPKTAARGNREPKVTEERRRLLDEAIAQWYARPKQQKVRDVFVLYQRACLEQHIQPVCERTFYRHVKQASGPALTEKRKGAKAAYQESTWYWELEHTTPRHGDRPWEIAHIDHTQLDIELLSSLGKPLGRPWATFLVDAYSRRLLAVYLTFDPPSYRSVMMVLRVCVRRLGRLPQMLVVDGGKEFRSRYFEALVNTYSCHKKYRPWAKPRYGAVEAEFQYADGQNSYLSELASMPTFTSKQPDPAPPSTPPTADQKTRKPKGHIGEPSPYRDQVGTVQQEGETTHCSFSGPIKLEAARWLESKVQEVQCSMCGSVSKAKLKEQSVVISPHPPRKSRPVRNVTRWMEQESDWVLVQKKE